MIQAGSGRRTRKTIVIPAGGPFLQQAEADADRCGLPVTVWARQVLEGYLAERRCAHARPQDLPANGAAGKADAAD